MPLYGYICLIFTAIQTLIITVQMPTTYSRDQLLPLRASVTLLNHDQRARVTQLGLRRRGCRTGNHTRRSRQAARSVTLSTRCTSARGEIPVITGHRPMFTNNDQLFSCCRGEPCRAEATVCPCCSMTTRRRLRRQSPARLSALPAVPLCRHVELQAANAPPSSTTQSVKRNLIRIMPLPTRSMCSSISPPSLYVLNAAALYRLTPCITMLPSSVVTTLM